jgi:YD repeat-containing protein
VSVTTADGETSGIAYDADGNLISQGDPQAHITSFAYDSLGRVVEVDDALNGKVDISCDNNGNITAVTDPRGNTTTYVYDANDQLVSSTDPLSGCSAIICYADWHGGQIKGQQ